MNKKSIIESLLYVAGSDGISLTDIKKALDCPVDEIRSLLKEMSSEYVQNENFGLIIQNYNDNYYLLTKPSNKEYIAKLIDVRTKNPLSPAMLEVLAYVAYHNPTTLAKIDEVRSKSSETIIHKLESLGLINNLGRSETPGRPYQYAVSQKFFNLFGIKDEKDLPTQKIENINLDEFNFYRDEDEN